LAKLSVSGALEPRPSAFISAKTGDSSSLSRMYTETASRRKESRKGMRQPQTAN